VRLIDCPSADMLADVLTKNLPAPDFARHRDVMAGINPHTSPALPGDLTVPGPRCTPARQALSAYIKEDAARKVLGMCTLAESAARRMGL
jgi:hypothetical protein